MSGLGQWWESRTEHMKEVRLTRIRALLPAEETVAAFADYKIAGSIAPMGWHPFIHERATYNAPSDSLAGSFPETQVVSKLVALTSRRLVVIAELLKSKNGSGAKLVWEVPLERLRHIGPAGKRLLQFDFDDGTAVKVAMRVRDVDKFLQAASR